jgi:hypothetical protein
MELDRILESLAGAAKRRLRPNPRSQEVSRSAASNSTLRIRTRPESERREQIRRGIEQLGGKGY